MPVCTEATPWRCEEGQEANTWCGACQYPISQVDAAFSQEHRTNSLLCRWCGALDWVQAQSLWHALQKAETHDVGTQTDAGAGLPAPPTPPGRPPPPKPGPPPQATDKPEGPPQAYTWRNDSQCVWYCLLCYKWATSGHVESKKHQWRVQNPASYMR